MGRWARRNTTTDEQGQQLVYDAWNRLVIVKTSGGTTLITYSYDADKRRIQEITASTRDLYYSDQWQVLEERVGGQTKEQLVWASTVYVDALVLRDADTDGNGTLDSRLYVQQDANFNVTTLVTAAGTVVERYLYDPYGRATVLDANWATDSDGVSDWNWRYLHQGGRYETITGLYLFRHRDYDADLGRWLQQDPLGYVDGMGLFEFAGSHPAANRDPFGLSRNGGADKQLRPKGANWVGTGVFRCKHKGFKPIGLSSHTYVEVGGNGYGYYAASHLGSADFLDDLQTLIWAPGVVVDSDHQVPRGTSGERSECTELMVDPGQCDPGKVRAAIQDWVAAQLAAYPGKGGPTSNYNLLAYNCNAFALDAIREGILKGCNKCGGSSKGRGIQQYKFSS